jgi:hypothetical protein
MSVSAHALERFLAAVSSAGENYGLELHWGKLQLLKVRCNTAVHRPDHSLIQAQSSLLYLGSVVSDDGRFPVSWQGDLALLLESSENCHVSGVTPGLAERAKLKYLSQLSLASCCMDWQRPG